jgi:regulatory protein
VPLLCKKLEKGVHCSMGGLITLIEYDRKKKQYDVFIDEVFTFSVHTDVLVKYQLSKGMRIDASKVNCVRHDQVMQDAYHKVVTWLGIRPRTEREVRSRLQMKGVDAIIIEDCITQCKQQGFLDDVEYSKSLANERIHSHGKGIRWVQHELLHKGVQSDTVKETIASIHEQEELQSAIKIASKRWSHFTSKHEHTEAIRKLYGFLSRRGFCASSVRKAIQVVTNNQTMDIRIEDMDWE